MGELKRRKKSNQKKIELVIIIKEEIFLEGIKSKSLESLESLTKRFKPSED